MKKYTHAWIAMMAIKRLEKATMQANYKNSALLLIEWFKNHHDSVVQGAWYPDKIIKDMKTSHVLKFKPDPGGDIRFRKLPQVYNFHNRWKGINKSKYAYKIESGNLPDRCESIAHSIIDNLKMQRSEDKGSPISPTGNHVAMLFYMLSHYIADAHMPLHCDVRPFSDGEDLHAKIEKDWDDRIKKCYMIDEINERFFYDINGYPKKDDNDIIIDYIENETVTRKFNLSQGSGNNTWDFMTAICQYSYMTAYKMIPVQYDENLKWNDFVNLNINPSFDQYSKELLMDSIDSVAKIWLRVWRKYRKWVKEGNK